VISHLGKEAYGSGWFISLLLRMMFYLTVGSRRQRLSLVDEQLHHYIVDV